MVLGVSCRLYTSRIFYLSKTVEDNNILVDALQKTLDIAADNNGM